MPNQTRLSILINFLQASAGLMLYGVATYLMIQSGIGISPWDALNQGLSQSIGVHYGDASILISVLVLLVDVLMREKIGIGMFLDSILVGKTVDLLNWLDVLPVQAQLQTGIPMLMLGLVIGGFALAIYMNAALGCGPRDSVLVGISRRLPKVPIGVISMGIFLIVSVAGFLMGGPLGVGTILCVLFQGPIMQLCFYIVRFDPTGVFHQDILTSFKILMKKQAV